MIMGAIVGFMVTIHTESPVLGFVCGALGGAAISLVFAFLTQVLLATQVATGLALTLFGLGLSALLGQGYNGLKPVQTEAVPLGPLADIPFFGQVLFSHDWIVYFSIFMTAAIWYVLKSTRLGLIIRAVGESHEAAHALGLLSAGLSFSRSINATHSESSTVASRSTGGPSGAPPSAPPSAPPPHPATITAMATTRRMASDPAAYAQIKMLNSRLASLKKSPLV